jgi:hypothetical protein
VWLIPLLVIGAVVFAAASRSPRDLIPLPSRQLAFPAPPPGPISVLGEFVRVGQVPPPPVILCAIAEAESIGRGDLASDIVRVFVAPVVYQHELMNARRVRTPCERGTCALPRSPREASAPSSLVQAPRERTTDDEIRAMLNADPQGFIEMAARRAPVIEVPVEAAQMEVPMQPPRQPPPPMPSDPQVQPTGLPPEVVAQMQDNAGLHEAADQTRALAPGSPIAGVSDDAWREFVMRLEREAPSYQSARHVGQYRQRRERLAELGIDPKRILGSAQAQRAALDVDLIDAHRHAADGGLLGNLGRRIALPGSDAPRAITLSGVLGVIQCAGLDGAASWLESQRDRKRFPHTTQAFTRSNGVF